MIEQAWERVRREADRAAAIRVDPDHPADFFAAQDDDGRPGLILVLRETPPARPRLESVDVVVDERTDGRWNLGIYLAAPHLITPFTQLCEDLMTSSREIQQDRIGAFVLARLCRWHDLLERARAGMSLSKLRGLIGELLLLRSAIENVGPVPSVEGWAGPYSAPQDFTLPGCWIEVKATFPTGRTVRISSADQLAAPGQLYLAVVTLATLMPQEVGITALGLVGEIRTRLSAAGLHDVAVEFGKRVSATGFDDTAEYAVLPFRQDALHFFEVGGDFPRLVRAGLPSGIAEVAYDLELGALIPYEVSSPLVESDGAI